MLKKLITVVGLAGTLGFAAPAFADWYQPAPGPVYGTPVGREGWRRDEEWRRREAWERSRRWHHWEWERHHHGGYYRGW